MASTITIRKNDPALTTILITALGVAASVAGIAAAKKALIDEPRLQNEEIEANIRDFLRRLRSEINQLIEVHADYEDLINKVSGDDPQKYWGEQFKDVVYVLMTKTEIKHYVRLKKSYDNHISQIKNYLNFILEQIVVTNTDSALLFIEIQDSAELVLNNALGGKLTYGQVNSLNKEFLETLLRQLRDFGGNRL